MKNNFLILKLSCIVMLLFSINVQAQNTPVTNLVINGEFGGPTFLNQGYSGFNVQGLYTVEVANATSMTINPTPSNYNTYTSVIITMPPGGIEFPVTPPAGFPTGWAYYRELPSVLHLRLIDPLPSLLFMQNPTPVVFELPIDIIGPVAQTPVNNVMITMQGRGYDWNTGSFAQSSIYVLDNNNPLPIDLESFTAQEADCQVALEWTTASERNNAYFSIERSADGRNFEAIHKANGAGDSYERITYNYVDESPLTGKNLYRIRQVDFDGQSTSSLIEAVNINCNNSAINIYPNPTKNVVYVNGLNAGNVVEVYNVVGQLVVSKTTESQQEIISLNNLAAGMYQVKVLSNNQVIYNGKVVKSN